MGPSRGDTICGSVVIDALAPRKFGARAFGPVYLAHSPDEPNMWLTVVDRTLLPRAVDVSRFMANLGGLLVAPLPGCVPLVLVDRESDYCVVGHRVLAQARTVAQLTEEGPEPALSYELGRQLARALGAAHERGVIHGLLTASTVLRVGDAFLTWQGGIAGVCIPERLRPRLRPLAGDAVAPELRLAAPLGPATDVFGWGAVVAALLTGRLDAEAVAQVHDEVHDDDPWWSLVRSCLDPVAKLRPPNGRVLADAVARLAPPRAIEADETSFADLNEPGTQPQRHRRSVRARPRVDEIELGPVLDEHERATDAIQSRDGGAAGEQSWRELAERYLADADVADPRREEESPAVHDADPPIVGGTPRPASPTGLGRVALVRVRTGPVRVIRADPEPVAGEFELEPAVAEPEPPNEDADAPPLPLGSGDVDDWPDDLPAFDLGDIDSALEPIGWNEPTPVEGLGTPRWRPLDVPVSLRHAAGLSDIAAGNADSSEAPSDPDLAALTDLAPHPEPHSPPARTKPDPRDLARGAPLLKAPVGDSLEAALLEPVADVVVESPPRGNIARAPQVEGTPEVASVVPAVVRTPRRSSALRADPPPTETTSAGPDGEVDRGNNTWVAAIAIAAGALVVGVTLAGAARRGGLANLFAGAPAGSRGAPTPAPAPAGGQASNDAKAEGCPDAMVRVPGTSPPTCIDIAEYPGTGALPRTGIDLRGAAAACGERRARLCTQAEWRSACRGPSGQRHPYGARSEFGRCNVASPSGVTAAVAPSGENRRCTTAAGVFDLEGNVAEWVAEGFAMGGDVGTRGPSCETRTRPDDDARVATLGLRCCVTVGG